MAAPPPGPILLCAGQYGSASTWLYNAAHALLAAEYGPARVHRQFADSTEDLPAQPDQRALVLKSHVPGAGLRWLLARAGGKAIITLRDPRDAAASLLHRFDFAWPLIAGRIERSAEALPRLAEARLPVLLLRYEEGFADKRHTLVRLARFLGLSPPDAVLDDVFARLRPDAVRSEIARLEAAGAFGPNPTAHSHDRATHWHPGHVGDGEIGKFARLLTPGQIGDIIRRTRAYQDAFDYALPPPPLLAAGQSLPLDAWGPGLAYLGHGFAPADEEGAWTEGQEARLHLPGAAGLLLDLDLELPRPARNAPANPMRWSLWPEGATAPLHGPIEATHTPPRGVVSVRLDGPGDLLFRFENLAPANETGLEKSRRLLGLRLRGFALRAS
ncbi:sulfotransferase domain-containing protein [Leptolyngbya sp. 15MV]|nr:sulfotransferase domain-containing protein [Leptolyngbya sp. 15MV]